MLRHCQRSAQARRPRGRSDGVAFSMARRMYRHCGQPRCRRYGRRRDVYRIDGLIGSPVIADIGAWSIAHPPKKDFFIPSGVQFALEPTVVVPRHGRHQHRVPAVRLNGKVSQRLAFGELVPDRAGTEGRRVFMAEAGPVPHLPRHGRIVTFAPGSRPAHLVASGPACWST